MEPEISCSRELLTDEEMDNFMKEASSNFIIIQDDTKYIKYPDFALHLKDQYQAPVVEDKKNTNKNKKN